MRCAEENYINSESDVERKIDRSAWCVQRVLSVTVYICGFLAHNISCKVTVEFQIEVKRNKNFIQLLLWIKFFHRAEQLTKFSLMLAETRYRSQPPSE